MTLAIIFKLIVLSVANEPQLLPPDVALSGPAATQQLLVVATSDGGTSVADLTSTAVFSSSDADIAMVDTDGTVRAVSAGQARIVARLPGGREVFTRVTVTGTGTPQSWSFRNDVRAVMTKAGCNAGRCHGAAAGQNQFKLSLRGFDLEADYGALTRGELGRRVSLVDPAESLMLLKPTLQVPHAGGKRFDIDSSEYRLLYEWIASRARPPQDNDPYITGLEVFPTSATLKSGDRHRIVIRGLVSDGRAKDLSPWAIFSTSDPSVATVDDGGQVTVLGPGESTISVWCLDHVAGIRITVPFAADILAETYVAAPRHNYVDDFVLQKLQTMRIAPSPSCGDSEFIRRAYLDAAGILPTAEEAREFLADSSADKRQQLIESLVTRQEFVDLWAYKWSELLLVSSAKLRPVGARAFHEWIRASVKSNVPWDRFVREIITAAGSTIENGPANYYLLHPDATAVAENVTQTFLGLSIHCARCHNHPLDKWTQDDYYALSSFFARVGRKNDLAVGYANNDSSRAETTIFLADRGEVTHPRRGRPLAPRPLESGAISLDPDGDRREVFARWMTSSENRYFVRATVNRIWKHFMGRGLVEPVDDLRMLNRASNERLMQALSDEFVERGFDVNQLIRTIMYSAAYQATATPNHNAHDDRYYSHFWMRQLPAEIAVDIISQAVGVSEEFAGFPAGTRALQLPDSTVGSYTLTVLGRPAREINSHHERIHHSTVAQALHLVNGEFISQKLRSSKGTLQTLLDSSVSDEEIVREIYWISLARPPRPPELDQLLTVIGQVTSVDEPDERAQLRREVFEDFWAGLLISKEFLCNH